MAAICVEEDVAADQQDCTPLNAELAPVWKPSTRTKSPLPDEEDRWAIKGRRAEPKR